MRGTSGKGPGRKAAQKRRKGRGMLLAAALLSALAGCGKEEKESGEAVTGTHVFSAGEDGIVYVTSLERGENKLLFYDSESETVYPVCGSPTAGIYRVLRAQRSKTGYLRR